MHRRTRTYMTCRLQGGQFRRCKVLEVPLTRVNFLALRCAPEAGSFRMFIGQSRGSYVGVNGIPFMCSSVSLGAKVVLTAQTSTSRHDVG